MRAEAKRFRLLSMAGPARAMPIAEYFFNHMYTFFGLTRSASSCTMGEKARGATALYKILRKERLNLYKAEEAQGSEHVCRLTGGKR